MPKTLFIYVDDESTEDYAGGHSTPEFSLYNQYLMALNKHNDNVNNENHSDSGFDLFYPEKSNLLKFENLQAKKIDFKIKCAMVDEKNNPCAYYLYPRSSISKTGLRLANSVGIIDSGYRGNICGYFDPINANVSLDKKGSRSCFDFIYNVEQGQRFVQICAHDLSPFVVKMVNTVEDLGLTSRGSSGFGSTGLSGLKL